MLPACVPFPVSLPQGLTGVSDPRESERASEPPLKAQACLRKRRKTSRPIADTDKITLFHECLDLLFFSSQLCECVPFKVGRGSWR